MRLKMDICILQYNIYEILSICVYTNRFVGSVTCLPMRREHAYPHIKQSPRSTHGFFPQLHILITLRSLSAQPHRQNWQNCVRGPSLELGGRTPQVAGLTRTGGERVWSLRGTSWVQANHRTEGGGVICFRLVALSGLESTSEANICSRGTKWDVTDKHDMSRWLAGLGMFGNWRWKPSNLYAEWMLQMTSQSNPWDPSLGLEHWLIQPGNLRWNVNLSSYQDTHTHTIYPYSKTNLSSVPIFTRECVYFLFAKALYPPWRRSCPCCFCWFCPNKLVICFVTLRESNNLSWKMFIMISKSSNSIIRYIANCSCTEGYIPVNIHWYHYTKYFPLWPARIFWRVSSTKRVPVVILEVSWSSIFFIHAISG